MARIPFGLSNRLSIRPRRSNAKDNDWGMSTEKAPTHLSEKENRLTARFGFIETPEQSVDGILDSYVDYDQETIPSNESCSVIAPSINEQAWEALVAGNSMSTPQQHSRNSSVSSKRRSLITITSKRRSLCEMMCEAASTGDVPQVGRLLGAGADLKRKSKDGLLPVHLAAAGGHLGVLKSLAMHGAKMDVTDQCGRTALHAAVLGRQATVLPFLIQSGVPIGAKDANGYTALHLAAQMETPEDMDLENTQNNKVRFSYVFGTSKVARRASTCSGSSTYCTPLEALVRAGADAGNMRVESRL